MVISEVFRDPVPAAPPAGPVMLLEGLQAGIAGQLAVLDDAGLTGTGQSSADVLGVPSTVLADRLTGHLVREIIVRGSGGGPLAPLADQFNHELTRLHGQLQGQRIEGMLARLADQVRDVLPRPDSGVTVAGRPLGEVTDPFVLEVHRPVQPEDAPPGLPLLPPYVPREHDQVLGQVVRAAADGRSGIAVLVGGSSVGKTRACWEALALLRSQDPPWRLWHPIDLFRSDAALAELAGIGPRTVVWLNEAQFYLAPAEAGLGERVAAGLRELLRDPGRAPVLVLATMWPRFWHALTARADDGEDRHGQARELLAGHDITVPGAFTPAQMGQLAQAADARMALAARSAHDGEVIQFLAGAPELLARYRNALPAAKALIDAAMDARRLGMGVGLPQAFLEAAAPGYLTDAQWDGLGEDWLEQALAYTAVPCKGARGPLTRVRPRPASRAARDRGGQPASMAAAAGPLYRLADYLDQHGRAHRAGQIPPAEFWSAAAAHAAPGDQAELGDAAWVRGLYRDAAQLHKNAAASGDLGAAYLPQRSSSQPACGSPPCALGRRPRRPRPSGRRGQAAGQPAGGGRGRAGRRASRPGRRPRRPRPSGRRGLAAARHAGGGRGRAGRRTGQPGRRPRRPRQPARHGRTAGLAVAGGRARAGRRAGRPGRRPRRPRQPARHGRTARQPAAGGRGRAGRRAAGPRSRRPRRPRQLAWRGQPAEQPAGGGRGRAGRRAAGPRSRLPRRPRRPGGRGGLLGQLREAGADEQAAVLAARAVVHAALDHPGAVAWLLHAVRGVGADEQAAALAARAAAHAVLDNPSGVAELLVRLREAGADEQAAALLARDPAAHAALDNPLSVADLLAGLRAAGADEQAAALAARAAAHVALDNRVTWPAC